MLPEPSPHALLRIGAAGALRAAEAAPPWVGAQLACAPWVVARRERCRDGLLPVGVRGRTRAERFAAWLDPAAVLECVTPAQLAARRGWRLHPRRAEVAALAALDAVEAIMAGAQLAGCWGPAGSVAFELVSGCATTGPASDLDLVVLTDEPLAAARAARLVGQLAALTARVDVQLETPQGALSLGEYVRARAPFLLRTADGPRLSAAPWAPAGAGA